MPTTSFVNLSGTSYHWEFAEAPDENAARELSSATSIPIQIVRILLGRELDAPEKIEQFVHPSLTDLCDPFALGGMQQAVERIVTALREREKIVVYGDYDVDGITSTALMFLVLNRLGADAGYYLPNRLVEGYGLSEAGIDKAVAEGVKLIVTVDCGITATAEIEYAREHGVDVIVTDHHEPGSEVPRADAIVNPKVYPENPLGQELAGVGVAFKVAQAIYRTLGQNERELEEHLDLVALGTAADIAPLVHENRILTKYGIEQIARTSKPGLKQLSVVANLIGRPITTGQVVFVIAPRINAVGRLGAAGMAVQLLTTRDESLGRRIAEKMEQENEARKKLDEHTLREALVQVEETYDRTRHKAIVISSEGWHQGVIGIVASRIVEKYHVPTVLIAIDRGEGKASARSIPSFHLYDALRGCEQHLLRYGGHKYAAGLSILPEKIEAFRRQFLEVAARQLSNDDMVPKLVIDGRIDMDDISDQFIDSLEMFSPFGPQNMRPVFVSDDIQIVGNPYVVGRGHLKFKAGTGTRLFDCIGFNMGALAADIQRHRGRVDMAYVAERVVWNNTRKIQFRIKDIQLS